VDYLPGFVPRALIGFTRELAAELLGIDTHAPEHPAGGAVGVLDRRQEEVDGHDLAFPPGLRHTVSFVKHGREL
jgi:hypothetical protein